MSEAGSRVIAVLLAAGASRRLGRPKQLVHVAGERLLDRAVRLALEAGCAPVVVLGAEAEQVLAACDLSRCHVLRNPDWPNGMGGSIRAGVCAAKESGAQRILLMTCDQPAVTAEHLRRLLTAQDAAPDQPVASAYAGRKGVPACFPSAFFPSLAALNGDSGARELLRDALAIQLPGGQLDVDTEESLQLAEQYLTQTGE